MSYVEVAGEAVVRFTVRLPVELARKGVACDDPAVEAAMQAISENLATFLWGEDEPPAVVLCDVNEDDVTIEDDDREPV